MEALYKVTTPLMKNSHIISYIKKSFKMDRKNLSNPTIFMH